MYQREGKECCLITRNDLPLGGRYEKLQLIPKFRYTIPYGKFKYNTEIHIWFWYIFWKFGLNFRCKLYLNTDTDFFLGNHTVPKISVFIGTISVVYQNFMYFPHPYLSVNHSNYSFRNQTRTRKCNTICLSRTILEQVWCRWILNFLIMLWKIFLSLDLSNKHSYSITTTHMTLFS